MVSKAILGLALLASLAVAAPHPSWSTDGEPWPTPSTVHYSASSTRQPQTSLGSTSTPSYVTGSISTPAPKPTSSGEYACATVSSLVAVAAAASPSAIPTIPAQIAWDCLQSVPLNATAGVPWVQSLEPYINWQTTTSYLKNPPPGYLEPAVDVYSDLAAIISNLQSGTVYTNEYDLEFAIYRLFQTTHDGHFRYTPTLVGGVFAFGRPVPLVSVSPDGSSLPKAYVYADILLAISDTTFAPSAITAIDGQDATAYLENWAQYGSLQDPDALYNNVFYELAQISLGNTGTGPGTFAGGGRGALIYPNATTSLKFENGTTATFENLARVLQPFTGIQTGQDIYNQYLAPPPVTTTATPVAAPTPTSTPAPGYPPPVLRQENNLIGGYYLSDPAYSSIAVLSVPSFVGLGSEEASFQDVATAFIADAVAAGKTKLVIDVSANGGGKIPILTPAILISNGQYKSLDCLHKLYPHPVLMADDTEYTGTILQGYSLFKNLFPSLVPYGATRFRAHEAFNIIGETVSAAAGPNYPWDNLTAIFLGLQNATVLDDFYGTPFDYRADVDINGNAFTSWAEKYGPHEYNGDEFTSIIRWNLSDPTDIYASGLIVDGYQNRTDIPPSQPFAAEDIVIVYDGYCASTCTIFSEFMTAQGGVKTVAIGGRPQHGIMQAVGGVKGTNDYTWDEIYSAVNDTFTLGTPAQRAAWEGTELGQYSTLPFERAVTGYAVNARDGIRQGDASETPLQFIYQPADCRIWYTAEMTVDVTAMWEKVVDVTWGGDSCVAGGLGKREMGTRSPQRQRRSNVDVEALAAGMETWTDLRGERVVGNAYMMP